jgi:hypothetical protein
MPRLLVVPSAGDPCRTRYGRSRARGTRGLHCAARCGGTGRVPDGRRRMSSGREGSAAAGSHRRDALRGRLPRVDVGRRALGGRPGKCVGNFAPRWTQSFSHWCRRRCRRCPQFSRRPAGLALRAVVEANGAQCRACFRPRRCACRRPSGVLLMRAPSSSRQRGPPGLSAPLERGWVCPVMLQLPRAFSATVHPRKLTRGGSAPNNGRRGAAGRRGVLPPTKHALRVILHRRAIRR